MNILVLGGTGAMGTHVCHLLADAGHNVSATTRRKITDTDIRFIQGDAKDKSFLVPLLERGWDVVVDFMIWDTDEFVSRIDGLLAYTEQYVFLSSYRVYADSPVITEESPRLLDIIDDDAYLATDEYALRKARCEDLLFSSGRNNWTIVRPTVTYDGSVGRLQFGVLEAQVWLWRAMHSIPIPVAAPMLGKQATMTWGGDAAKMIVALMGNSKAYGEAFTVATSEHMCWSEIADAYCEILPMELAARSLSVYERAGQLTYQLRYDRLFDRVIDNTKILDATGLSQQELLPMRSGLQRELRVFLEGGAIFDPYVALNAHCDKLVGDTKSLSALMLDCGEVLLPVKYAIRRFIR